MTETPQFVVKWSSPWREFLSAIGPALGPSPPQLHIEARAGLFPLKGMLLTLLLEFAAIAAAVSVPTHILQPETEQPSAQLHDIIYFSADELPRTQDLAGGSAGRHGKSGGTSLMHPSQIIKVARGEKLEAKVIDAPSLHLPKSDSQISNLLAYNAVVPPAPQPLPRPPSPIVVRTSREHSRTKSEPELNTPKIFLPKNILPDLPQASVTPVAPPPVAAPIKVSREHAKMTLPAPAAAPNMPASREQMPTLPEASVSVKAPPTPIRVTRSRANARSPEAVAPSVDINSKNERLASIVSGAAPNLPAAPPKPASNMESKTVAVIVTSNPGTKAAVPKDQEKTTVAMANGGSTSLGSGGTGGGTGMQPGKGTGSSTSGSNAGATEVGNDKGRDYYARTGNSPYLGPGGTGNMSSGNPRAPGVSVSGGKTSITLPSFGGPPASASSGRSEIAKNMGTGITVVASPRAGGALNLYGALKGDRVYTIYINTRLGTAVMQFADPNSVERAYTTDLTSPRVLRADVPDEISGSHAPRVLISCDLNSKGVITNPRILQSADPDFASKLLASLPGWKFSPAYRGNDPVEVNAILGFGVDTK